MGRKAFALILTMMLALTLFPQGVFAQAAGEGAGEPGTPTALEVFSFTASAKVYNGEDQRFAAFGVRGLKDGDQLYYRELQGFQYVDGEGYVEVYNEIPVELDDEGKSLTETVKGKSSGSYFSTVGKSGSGYSNLIVRRGDLDVGDEYEIGLAIASYTIDPAPLDVTLPDVSVPAGTTPSKVAYSLEVNEAQLAAADRENGVTWLPELFAGSDYTASASVGERFGLILKPYGLTQAQTEAPGYIPPVNANYKLNIQFGSLTVTPIDLTATVNGETVVNGETLYFAASITRGVIQSVDGAGISIVREDGTVIGASPATKLTANHKYTVTVTSEGTTMEFYIVVDAAKPTVTVNSLKKSWNDERFVAYTSNTWTNGAVKALLGVSAEPISEYTFEYKSESSTHPWLVSGPPEWTKVEGNEIQLFDGGYIGEEVTAVFRFRTVTKTGMVGAEKAFTVKIDQKGPQLVSVSAQPAEGYDASSKGVTYTFTDPNAAGGSYDYTLFDFYEKDASNYREYVYKENVNIKTVALTANGTYRDFFVSDNLGNWTYIDPFSIDKEVPALGALKTAQMYPGVKGSPVIVTLEPSIADGHKFKLQYSYDNATWVDFDGGSAEAEAVASAYADEVVAGSNDVIDFDANKWTDYYTFNGAEGIYGAVDNGLPEAAFEEMYDLFYELLYTAMYPRYLASTNPALDINGDPEKAAEITDWYARVFAEHGTKFNPGDYYSNNYSILYAYAYDEYAAKIWEEAFEEKYSEILEDYADSAAANQFVIYPKNGIENTDKIYFRAVNAASGLVSTVRSYTPGIGPGPLVMFGSLPVPVAEDGSYTIGKQVAVSEVKAYVDGVAEIAFAKRGVPLSEDATLASGQTYTATLIWGSSQMTFTVMVNTARPNFALSAVTTAKGSPDYTKNTWVKDNVKLTIAASNPDMAATYYYSIDEGATWRKITLNGSGSYTFSVSCAAESELDRNYQFRAVADSGAEAAIQSFKVKIDKTPLVLETVSGTIADGMDAYSSGVTLTANKPVTYTYTFTAPGGVPEEKAFSGSQINRQFSDNGEYTNIIGKDKVGNIFETPAFIVAKKPDLTLTVNGAENNVVFSVTNATSDTLIYEYSADKGKTWQVLDETEFTAQFAGEYRFRATNTLSGSVSSVKTVTLTSAP